MASECARRRGKSGVSGARIVLAAITAAGLTALAPQVLAAPTGGNVTHGSAFIWQDNPGNVSGRPKNTVISQTTSKAVINWNTFDVAANEYVTFNHMDPSHMTLNNVTSLVPSNIAGAINAVGKVFLVNPNGIIFQNAAQVNVGSLVASTHATNANAFFNNSSGIFNFDAPAGQNNPVTNLGSITSASGGDIVLLGNQVRNQGNISTNGGSVALGAGGAFTVRLGSGPLNLSVTAGGTFARAGNEATGKIQANGGQVVLMARDSQPANPLRAVVNNTGVIEAKTLQNQRGRIVLDGGTGTVQAGGWMDANALGTYGDGGSVSISGGHVNVLTGTLVDTRASNGYTGSLDIRGDAIKVGANAASPGNIQAGTLANNLSTTNVSLSSSAGDVEVNAPVSWDSGHALTLNARHGGGGKVAVNGALTARGAGSRLNLSADRQIDISQRITLSGVSSQVYLDTTQSGTSGPPSTANYVLNGAPNQAGITLSGANPTFVSNGLRHVVIQNLAQLNAVSNHLSGYYVLGNDIRGGTLQSIGEGRGGFSGLFDGLGNKLADMTVQSPMGSDWGVFHTNSGTLRNLSLEHLYSPGDRKSAYTGTLTARNTGTISNVHAIYSKGANIYAQIAAGGLVGINEGGLIERSSASGGFYASGSTSVLGGLVGINASGIIRDSSTSGSVKDTTNRGGNGGSVGGLVGINQSGQINNSTNSASVETANRHVNLGGAVGQNNGLLLQVGNTGAVTSRQHGNVGGLAGVNTGQITESTSSGGVSSTGYSNVGGLVGENSGSVSASSQTTGEVGATDAAAVGGLVGKNNSGAMVTNSTSSSDRVYMWSKAQAGIGGLVGVNAVGAIIRDSAATGKVVSAHLTKDIRIGGLVGINEGDILQSQARLEMVRGGPNASVGGLVGRNTGRIVGSASTVTQIYNESSGNVGGLAGDNNGTIWSSVASGRVTGGDQANLGGLVGVNFERGSIAASESSGSVEGKAYCSYGRCTYYTASLGGLVGLNQGEIVGSVTRSKLSNYDASRAGGLVGINRGVMRYNAALEAAAQIRPVGTNQGTIEP